MNWRADDQRGQARTVYWLGGGCRAEEGLGLEFFSR